MSDLLNSFDAPGLVVARDLAAEEAGISLRSFQPRAPTP